MRFLTFCFLSCLFLVSSAQIDVTHTLSDAEEHFKTENYSKTIELYQNLLKEGYSSNDLNLNLGIAYYENENLPKAILHFEKVLKKSPFDSGALTNLKIVNDQRASDISEIPDFFLMQWWRNFSGVFSSTIWSLLGLIMLGLSSFIFYRWLFVNKRYRQLTTSILIFVLGVYFLLAARTSNLLKNETTHLINLKEASIKEGPDNNSKEVIAIIPGEKLKILDQVGEWYQVLLINKEEGWIEKSLTESI